MKNPNGFGSVYKQSGKRRNPWIARVTIGYTINNDGKAIQTKKVIGSFSTRSEALNALASYNNNPIKQGTNITLEVLYNEWLNSKYDLIKPKTKAMYETAWNHLHILKDVKVKDIKKTHIQSIINDLNRKNYSYSSIHKVKVLAKQLLDQALADDLIAKNYATLVDLPKKEKKEAIIFTDVEIEKIRKLAETDDWAKCIMIMIYSGFRVGELLSITKFNTHIDSLAFIGGAKTEAGKNRIVPISPKIIKYVQYFYNKNSNYLITYKNSKIRVDYFRKYLYYPTLEKAGTRKLSPHTTRKTFGSLLNSAGADKVAIQRVIGHASYSTTADIYTSVPIEDLRKAINLI